MNIKKWKKIKRKLLGRRGSLRVLPVLLRIMCTLFLLSQEGDNPRAGRIRLAQQQRGCQGLGDNGMCVLLLGFSTLDRQAKVHLHAAGPLWPLYPGQWPQGKSRCHHFLSGRSGWGMLGSSAWGPVQTVWLGFWAVLTGDAQVGMGLDLPSFITGKALEDSRILRTQLLDVQASTC